MLLYLPFITFLCISEEMRALDVKSKRGNWPLLNFFSLVWHFLLVFVLKNVGSSVYLQSWLSRFRFSGPFHGKILSSLLPSHQVFALVHPEPSRKLSEIIIYKNLTR